MGEGRVFGFDVESIGLHGEGFAVGYVVYARGKEVESGYFAVEPDIARGRAEDRMWVKENVPYIKPTHTSLVEMRSVFWKKMVEEKNAGAIILTDCGWPVETNFLSACVNDCIEGRSGDKLDERCWEGPYPLIDAINFVEGFSTESSTRFQDELPVHNPVADARQSTRIWLENERNNFLYSSA